MVNFGLNSASILGIVLAVAGAALYFLRSVRPELSRDQDIFFAAVGLLCGGILLFQGWRLDPILQFGQFLLTGSAIFFAFETIRLRGVTTEVAKRNTRIVDDDRPVSRSYRAELMDELEPVEDYPDNRRLRGTTERRSRNDDYEEDYRRPPSRSSADSRSDRPSSTRTRTTRRPRPDEGISQRDEDEWESPRRSTTEEWSDERPTRTVKKPRPSSGSRSDRDLEASPKPKKRRPSQDSSRSRQDTEAIPTDYVDYQPIDPIEDEKDDSEKFDY